MIFNNGYAVITPDPATLVESVGLGNVSPKDDTTKTKSEAISDSSGLDARVDTEKCKLKYACPSQGCTRNIDSPRQHFFDSLYSLKMHYRSVHAEKTFKCRKCSKMFGNQLVFSHHERTCMTIHYCQCGMTFKSKNALQMHAKRKQHKMAGKEPTAKEVLDILTDVSAVNHIQTQRREETPSKSYVLPRLLRFLPKDKETNDTEHNDEFKAVRAKLSKNKLEIDGFSLEKTLNPIENNARLGKSYHPSISHTDSIGDSLVSKFCKPNSNVDVKKKAKNPTEQSIDIFDEIQVSAKKLADTFTQTSSMENIPTLRHPRRVDMNTQTQFDTSILDTRIKPTTMETQTQINFYFQNDILMKSTTESQTLNSNDCFESPQTTSMDTQTQIDSLNFNDILKKLSMVTQTDLSFNDALKSNSDVQTQMNSYFDGYSTEVLETSESGVQCHLPYTMDENIFQGIDNETQTESLSSWLNEFSCPDYSNMESQTNLSYSLLSNELASDVSDGPIGIDKSIQLEGMLGISNTSDIILTESSNMSTQTTNTTRVPWFHEDLVFETSSTQTDYFENLDFMDIDFHMETGDNSVQSFSKDPLISGNACAEMQVQNNMETQTSISLYDLLDSSLMENHFNSDRTMSDIETQTNMCYQKYEEQMNDIQTQTTGH